jgi:hypothetical protein
VVGAGGTQLSGETQAVRSNNMNSSAFSCADRSPLRHVNGKRELVDEHLPALAPLQSALQPGQSLSVMQPVQKPATQIAPSHCELFVHALVQVPTVGALHRCERPQSLLSVHVEAVHPLLRQSLLAHSLSFVQTHLPLTQSPLSQSLSLVQLSGTQLPAEPPTQDAPLIEQLPLDVQLCLSQVPTTGGVQVAPNPQSVSALHALLVLTSASAETWKSLNTTRPHWSAAAAVTGVLNVMLRSMSLDDE